MLQVMNWSGKVLCLQNDPQTVLTAMQEAIGLLKGGDVWILSVTGEGQVFTGHIFVLSESDLQHGTLKIRKLDTRARETVLAHDMDLFLWLKNFEHAPPPFVGQGFEIFGPVSAKEN